MAVSLVERAQAGNQMALNQLVNEWYARIYNFAFKYLGDDFLASEVSQKTFITLYQKIHTIEESQKFRAWIYQVAFNHCHAEQKKRKSRWNIASLYTSRSGEAPPKTDLRRASNPEENLQHNELANLLQKALAKISAPQRAIIIMKEYEGLKFKEIAEVLGISENTVKSRLYGGLKSLRKVFEEWNINQENLYHGL